MGLTLHYSLKAEGSDLCQAREVVQRLRERALDLPFDCVGPILEWSSNDEAGEENAFGEKGLGQTEWLGNSDWPGDDSAGEDKAGDGARGESAPSEPNRWLLVQAERYVEHAENHYPVAPRHLIAFTTRPGEGCESASFGLCRYPDTVAVDGRRIPTQLRGWSWHSSCKTQYGSHPARGGIEHFLRCHLALIQLLDHAKSLGILEAVSDDGKFWETRDVQALAAEVLRWNQHVAGVVGRIKDLVDGEFTAPIAEYPNFEHLEAKGRDEQQRYEQRPLDDQQPTDQDPLDDQNSTQ